MSAKILAGRLRQIDSRQIDSMLLMFVTPTTKGVVFLSLSVLVVYYNYGLIMVLMT